MFCPNCGSEHPDHAKFCAECGASFMKTADSPAPVPAPAAPVPDHEPSDQAYPSPPTAAVRPAYEPSVDSAPAAGPAETWPHIHEPQTYQPPQQPAATYVQQATMQQPSYTQSQYSQPAQSVAISPRPRTKKPIVAMLLTFIALALAIAVFLLTFLFMFPSRNGDMSVTVYDLEGFWNMTLNLSGKDAQGAPINMVIKADLEMTYDYSSYVVIRMTPVSIIENGVAVASADLEDAYSEFYGYLYNGALYFDYPSEEIDATVGIPLSRGVAGLNGEGSVKIDQYGYKAKLVCNLNYLHA